MTTTAPAVEPTKSKVPELALHKFCEIIPACTEEEFKELKEDIKLNGLRLPIKTFDSKILDGRSRYRACVELEAEGHQIEFKKELFFSSAKEVSAEDALAYVISMNVKRRHLSASQRALIAARLVTSKLGGDRSVKLPTEITQDQVAKLAGVATKTVTDAVKVLGNPDLAEKVLAGKLAVAKAATQIQLAPDMRASKGHARNTDLSATAGVAQWHCGKLPRTRHCFDVASARGGPDTWSCVPTPSAHPMRSSSKEPL